MSQEVILEENKDDQWPETTKGHPKGLMTLFFSEMWERFCYYGMRTLLTLYLVKSLMKGDAEASLIYGAYTGLVYAAPILGGRMADKFMGYKYAVILGGILMAIGEFIILGGTDKMLMIGMGALIVGNGYFKANISTIVGKLYKDGDARRDSGFTIFYIGINVGALLATTVVAYVGETYGFRYGFGLAGIGMLLGIFIFWSGRKQFINVPGIDIQEAGKKMLMGPLNMVHAITLGSLLLIPLCYVLILNNEWLNIIFLGLFILVGYNLLKAGIDADKESEKKVWKDRMIALIIFMVINIVFWACFEQAGTSLTLFADRNVDRSIFGWTMPASMTQFFNPAFIVIFGSLFSMMWMKLTKINKNPSIPLKFAFGIIQLGLGFLLTKLALGFVNEAFQVPLITIVLLYLFHTTGELFLSPIGLSMVTKLAPKKIAGTAMGAWFLSFAIANLLGGQIATLTSEKENLTDAQKKEKKFMGTTLKKALDSVGTAKFDDWGALSEDIPKNINIGKYLQVKDWVEVRESIDAGANYNTFIAARESAPKFQSSKEWLDPAAWSDLGNRYDALIKKDSITLDKDKNAEVLDMEAWKYYKGGIAASDNTSLSLVDGFEAHKLKVQEKGLNSYTSVFSTIGFVLLGFAFLVILLNGPIKKLMHGVE